MGTPSYTEQPIPGHAICNLGDAMAIFSGGILRSNLHRVVPPPKSQSGYDRWSLVFFTRPGNSAILSALQGESEMIREAVLSANEGGEKGKYETGVSSGEWFARRIKNQRIKNRTVSAVWHRASQEFVFLDVDHSWWTEIGTGDVESQSRNGA